MPSLSSLQHPSLLLPAASVPLTRLEKEKEGIHPLASSCPPSSAPKGGIHGLRSEPGISCVIPSSAWTISFPAHRRGSGLVLPYHLQNFRQGVLWSLWGGSLTATGTITACQLCCGIAVYKYSGKDSRPDASPALPVRSLPGTKEEPPEPQCFHVQNGVTPSRGAVGSIQESGCR